MSCVGMVVYSVLSRPYIAITVYGLMVSMILFCLFPLTHNRA